MSEFKKRVETTRNILIENDERMSFLFLEIDEFENEDFANFLEYDYDEKINSNNYKGMIYDQTEYEDIKCSIGDLADNGCGFFSLLSVITVKTGHKFSYDEIKELAEYTNKEGNGLRNDQRMELLANYLSEEYNFTWKKGPIEQLQPALQSGKAVIALTPTEERSSGHFIPITGILENGNVVINDTNGYKYRNENGYSQKIDSTGFLVGEDIKISIRGSDSNGDGLDDDVWYFDFNDQSNTINL